MVSRYERRIRNAIKPKTTKKKETPKKETPKKKSKLE